MSVAFNGKSGEVDSWHLMASDSRSRFGWRSQSSVCWIGAAAVCLGFLLLTVILVAQNTSAINRWDTKYEKLIYEITKSRDSTRDERDLLKTNLSNLTEEMAALQSRCDSVAASREKLQEEINRLSLNRTDKACQVGWFKFNNKCYYISPNAVSKSWSRARKDCQEKGADLAIIKSRAEMDFVKTRYSITWIGLSRGQHEDEWKWVDGTDFEHTEFWQPGEPNNSDGEEDCAEVSREAAAFNDVPCSRTFSWVCEEKQ